jgi:hypothetical protein
MMTDCQKKDHTRRPLTRIQRVQLIAVAATDGGKSNRLIGVMWFGARRFSNVTSGVLMF